MDRSSVLKIMSQLGLKEARCYPYMSWLSIHLSKEVNRRVTAVFEFLAQCFRKGGLFIEHD